MQELSHRHGHTSIPSTEDTPLFGAEVDARPGRGHAARRRHRVARRGGLRQAEEARPGHVLASGRAGSSSCSSRSSPTGCRSSTPTATAACSTASSRRRSDHWFGTDSNGRDIFSRCVYGARVSLAIGVAAIMFGLTIGGLLGLIAGYHRRAPTVHHDDHGHPAGVPRARARLDARDVRPSARRRRPPRSRSADLTSR